MLDWLYKLNIKDLLVILVLMNSVGFLCFYRLSKMQARTLMDSAAIFKAICKKDHDGHL